MVLSELVCRLVSLTKSVTNSCYWSYRIVNKTMLRRMIKNYLKFRLKSNLTVQQAFGKSRLIFSAKLFE